MCCRCDKLYHPLVDGCGHEPIFKVRLGIFSDIILSRGRWYCKRGTANELQEMLVERGGLPIIPFDLLGSKQEAA